MEMLIIIILSAVLAISITLFAVYHSQIKWITRQLKDINSGQTNSRILISNQSRLFEGLASEINISLDKIQEAKTKYSQMDTQLRQSIANMSHDLRTPLTSIMGYIQLIDDDSVPSDEKKKYIDIVRKRSDSLKLLIEGFYELSRLEANEYKFEYKPVNIGNILCETAVSFYNDFLNNKIEPELKIDESAPDVIADESCTRRIISNLIQNVLKHGKNNVSISLQQIDGFVLTAFKNDAPDLTDEDVPHLFERFFTADRTRNGQNTGLGLAITKQLVEQMGHSISAELSNGCLSIIIKWKI